MRSGQKRKGLRTEGDWRRKSVKGWRADEVRKVIMIRWRCETFCESKRKWRLTR